MNFAGQRVAVAGMGVSGLAVGRAVQARGGQAVVFDQIPADVPRVFRAVDALLAAGVEAVPGWHGRLDPAGYDVLVVSPGFPRDHPAIRDMRGGGRPVWSEVEFASRIAQGPILAITGTNGKSTTTVMLWQLLNGGGRDAVLCGNISGSGYPEATLTEAALTSAPGTVLVAETSSYQLEWVETFAPTVAAITNITPDHMDRYRDFADYVDTKFRIFDRVGPGQSAVLNLDEPSTPEPRVRKAIAPEAALVGFSPSGSRPGSGVTRREGETLWLGDVRVLIADLPWFGEHNVTNAMMAWEMAARVTPPNEGTLEALRDFRGLANRMERLGTKAGIAVVNNSMCTNPAAVIASSRSVAGPQWLLMGGLTKNLDFAPVREYLQGRPVRVLLFGPDTDQMDAMLGGGLPTYSTLERAFLAAVAEAAPGDTVLLSPGCASAEPYANFRERGDDFRRIVKEWMDG